VTRCATLPSLAEVRTAITELGEAAGKPPTVLALARHLGLANTTFRRNFPVIATELNQDRSQSSSPHGHTSISRFEQLTQDNAKLRRANQELTEHLELAVANIQRLTIDNRRLHRASESASKVTRLDTKIGTT
jgi:hypothetical protein